ncbi:MAG: hypothetical protein KGL37_03920, partial [Acidobacteriota bacterium]|nr:hypothetical protein [Acidobacteriota bacterium]
MAALLRRQKLHNLLDRSRRRMAPGNPPKTPDFPNGGLSDETTECLPALIIDTSSEKMTMDRRTFIQSTSAAALAAAVPASRAGAAPAAKTVGIQAGAVSFVDEGVEQALDVFQQDAGINTLFVATFTYGRGIAGRQVPGQPLPDHGKQEYDTGTFFGGCYTAVDPKYFADTSFKSFRAPDLGNFDVLEAVLPSARKRGMKTMCWFEDVFRKDLPGIQDLEEKELSGENAATLCFNN